MLCLCCHALTRAHTQWYAQARVGLDTDFDSIVKEAQTEALLHEADILGVPVDPSASTQQLVAKLSSHPSRRWGDNEPAVSEVVKDAPLQLLVLAGADNGAVRVVDGDNGKLWGVQPTQNHSAPITSFSFVSVYD